MWIFLRLLLSLNLWVKLSVVPIFFLPLISAEVAAQQSSEPSSGKQTEGKTTGQPPVQTTEPWEIKVSAPGWLANVSGFTGFHGVNPYVNVGIGQILKHTNFVFAFGGEGEIRKGRFGVLANLGYLDAQAGVSGKDLVSRVGLGMQEFIGGFFGSYRVIQGPCGWLDLLVGFRATYVGQQTGLNGNESAIDATLKSVATFPFGSEIVLTYAPPRTDYQSPYEERAAELGEPWISFFTSEQIGKKLIDAGFSHVEFLSSVDAYELYFRRRPQDLEVSRRPNVVSALRNA